MKWISTLLLVLTTAFAHADSITVAAAISMKEALAEAGAAFTEKTGTEVKFSLGASGKLAEQIKGGAPIDVFVSAAQKQIDDLVNAKLIDKDAPKAIASNELVLIAPAKAESKLDSFQSLANVTRLSIGNPKSVPAGMYAQQVLEALKLGEPLKDRIIFGASVRQVLDYVERGEVDAGIVYRTDAMSSGEKVRVVAAADPKLHDPIVYPAAALKESTQKPLADAFVAFLQTEPARLILAKHGFKPPPAGDK